LRGPFCEEKSHVAFISKELQQRVLYIHTRYTLTPLLAAILYNV